jgi:hypothetical protein
MLCVANSAERKSADIGKLVFPVYAHQKNYNEINKVAFKLNAIAFDNLQGKISKAKIADNRGELNNLSDLIHEECNFEHHKPIRLTIDDITPEKLVDIAYKGNYSLLMTSSEGGSPIDSICGGKHDNKGGISIYLKGHDGESIECDRIIRGETVVEKLLLSVALAAQPQVIDVLFSDPKASERGLTGRFNYCFCSGNLGRREIEPPIIPDNLKAEYYALINNMLSENAHWNGEREVLKPSTQAWDVYKQWAVGYESRLEPDTGDLDFMSTWAGKYGKLSATEPSFGIRTESRPFLDLILPTGKPWIPHFYVVDDFLAFVKFYFKPRLET